ncbi:uncharacterized protein LOC141908523 isoform X2 [Tubulanus polymorphus]
MRSRPVSAGSRGSPKMMSPNLAQRSVTGAWVSAPVSSSQRPGITVISNSPSNEMILLQEKEQRILQLNQELSRLNAVEKDSQRKDQILVQLRDEVNQLRQSQSNMMSDPDVTQKLLQLENEVLAKKEEVNQVKDQLNRMQKLSSNQPAGTLRHELNEKLVEVNSVRTQLERTRKDKDITSGLVTQMQRDMSSKDSTISRLTREIENLKRDGREKDVQLSALTAKFARLKENKLALDEMEAKDKELTNLRQKFKAAENSVQEQKELVSSLKEELEKIKENTSKDTTNLKKMTAELDQVKAQLLDTQRSERQVRIDNEQTSKQSERFRNRVIQVAFSTPGVKYPEDEIKDDELLETLKKMIDERTEMHRKMLDMKESLKQANHSKKEQNDKLNKLKHHLHEAMKRYREHGRLSEQLRKEVSLLQSLATEENVSHVKNAVVDILQHELTWQQNIEDALQKCGVNTKLSNDEPAKHILTLYNTWESGISDTTKLKNRLDELQNIHQQDLDAQAERFKQEMNDKIKDAIEKTKLEDEEKLNQAIDEIRQLETEKRENALETELKKITELEESLEQLRSSIANNESTKDDNKQQAIDALEQLSHLKKSEEELKEELSNLKVEHAQQVEALSLDKTTLEKKFENDLSSYKEQIKQHSVTICAMEERLNKVMKKNKDHQQEITQLKQKNSELKNKPSPKQKEPPKEPPPKPQVIVAQPPQDILAMEQLIVVLRRENVDLKKQFKEQQAVILGLRKDLTGASARLTDMTGELSEAQKQELEKNKVTIRQQQKDLVELRQQLAKVSQIVDNITGEVKAKEAEISKYKAILTKFKNSENEKEDLIKNLETKLTSTEDEKNKQLAVLEKEGRITSEMTAMGAQCRGERHEQVISRQRDALVELRSRIKQLEQSRPLLPNHDQALQQVILLKKELAEHRAQQALAEATGHSALDNAINGARGKMTPQAASAEVEVEKSAHRETLDTLEESEKSYMVLLRAMASCLELEEIYGLRSMAHIPRDERDKLSEEREKCCEMLANRIKALKDRLSRKEDLLQGYETDLAKLRQAEELANRKHVQVESLATDVRSRTEEAQYLRESLHRTRDQLEQEKRLNSAIKQRKGLQLADTIDTNRSKQYPKHQCPVEDIHAKASARKKAAKEKLKRKDYEIKTLKSELTEKERDLCKTTSRLVNLETTMGMNPDNEFA